MVRRLLPLDEASTARVTPRCCDGSLQESPTEDDQVLVSSVYSTHRRFDNSDAKDGPEVALAPPGTG